jgi:hypothetical protein
MDPTIKVPAKMLESARIGPAGGAWPTAAGASSPHVGDEVESAALRPKSQPGALGSTPAPRIAASRRLHHPRGGRSRVKMKQADDEHHQQQSTNESISRSASRRDVSRTPAQTSATPSRGSS